ncbi:MAG: hypothetical protein Q9163_006041, partial [Psora crenata]
MPDRNQDYINLRHGRPASSSTHHEISRIERRIHQNPTQLQECQQASGARSKARKVFHYRAGSEFELMWKYIDEFLLLGKSSPSNEIASNARSSSYSHSARHNAASRPVRPPKPSHRSPCPVTYGLKEQRQKQTKIEQPECGMQQNTVWSEFKDLINSGWCRYTEGRATQAKERERGDREAARARAEKAAMPTPIYDSTRAQVPIRQAHGGSQSGGKTPRLSMAGTTPEATLGTYPFIYRKPVFINQKELKTVPKHDVKVIGLPQVHESVHVVQHRASSIRTVRPRRPKLQAMDDLQNRVTRFGDFMADPASPIAPPPPRSRRNLTTSSQCHVCGAEQALGFGFSSTGLWLCPRCLNPAFPVEAPRVAKGDRKSDVQHASPSPKDLAMKQSTLSRSRSPLSMISRSLSLSEDDEAFEFFSDGEI